MNLKYNKYKNPFNFINKYNYRKINSIYKKNNKLINKNKKLLLSYKSN